MYAHFISFLVSAPCAGVVFSAEKKINHSDAGAGGYASPPDLRRVCTAVSCSITAIIIPIPKLPKFSEKFLGMFFINQKMAFIQENFG